MALTAYCKKCAREVDVGETCPFCGTRLGKNAAHAAWCVERIPVKDWMSWNALMRILLPAALVILLLVLLAEGIAGGLTAVEKMLVSGFPAVLLILLGSILVLAFAALLLQGKELTDYVVDSRGIHEVHYLPNPTPLRLIVRMRSPSLLRETESGGAAPLLKLSEKDTMEIPVNINENYIDRIEVGQSAVVVFSAASKQRYPAKVTSIAKEASVTSGLTGKET